MYAKALTLLLVIAIAKSSPTSSMESSTTEVNFTPTTELSLCPCTNKTITPPFQHINSVIHGMTCSCHTPPAHGSHMRDDYVYSPNAGAHKLHTRAATWNEARKKCNEEGGHLAIINSNLEAAVLVEMFESAGPIKGATYENVSLVGIHDMYKEGEWVTILGDSLYKTGYTKWSNQWGGQPDNGGGNQNCGALLKESNKTLGGLDDVNCDVPFAFFCELPMTFIIH